MAAPTGLINYGIGGGEGNSIANDLLPNLFMPGGNSDAGLINMGAEPTLPGYTPIYDPSTMSLGTQMQQLLAADPTQYNTQPLQQLQANAENPNPSPWAQLESQSVRNQTQQGQSQAANQTAASTAQAEGNLAMNGGLSSGANERAQESGQQAGIGAQQSVQNQGNQQQLQIGEQDAANKQQEQMALPGMEAQAYSTSLQPIQMQGQADAQDMAALMANNQALNQYNMGAFGNEASLYGAGETANAQTTATENSGGLFGGGGFLGLGGGSSWLCTERAKDKAFTSDEKMFLAELLRYGRKVDRDFTKWYLKQGQTLVTLMKASSEDWKTENNQFVDKILALQDNIHEAYVQYKRHVYALNEKYWMPILTKGAA